MWAFSKPPADAVLYRLLFRVEDSNLTSEDGIGTRNLGANWGKCLCLGGCFLISPPSPFLSLLPLSLPSPPSLVPCAQLTDVPYFAGRVKLGKNGWEDIVRSDLEGLTESEAKGVEALKAELKASIEKGIAFANKAPALA